MTFSKRNEGGRASTPDRPHVSKGDYMNSTKQEALSLLRAGFSFIPLREDGSKAPRVPSWSEYQTRQPTQDEIDAWFGGDEPGGLAVVCGVNNVTMIDVDDPDLIYRFLGELTRQWPEWPEHLCHISSPRPGAHLWLRLENEPPGNLKLAKTPEGRTLIETRGRGGYGVHHVSVPAVHPSGEKYEWLNGPPISELEPIPADRWELLLSVARSFHRGTPERQREVREPYDGPRRPGGLFDARADWTMLLELAGWTLVDDRGEESHWRRPGKLHGTSAVLGHLKDERTGVPLLSVFSTSVPFGPDGDSVCRAVTPFEFWTFTEFGGDFQASAKEAARLHRNDQLDAALADRLGCDAFCPSKYDELLLCLSEVTPREVEWLWPPFIPLGKVTMVSAREGSGKSFCYVDACARTSCGRDWPCGSGNMLGPRSCIVLSAEDKPHDTLHPRFRAAQANLDNVLLVKMSHRLESGGHRMVTIQSDLCHIVDAAIQELARRKAPPPAILVLDPVTAFMGDSDSNSTSETRNVMATLTDLAEAYGLALMFIHHHGKRDDGGLGQRYLGSTSFRAAVRSSVDIIADPNDKKRRIFALTKSNVAEANQAIAYRIVKAGPGQQDLRLDWEEGGVFEFDERDYREPDRRGEGKGRSRALLKEHLLGLADDPDESWPKPAVAFKGELRELFGVGEKLVAETLAALGFVTSRSTVPGEKHFTIAPPHETSAENPRSSRSQIIAEVIRKNGRSGEYGEDGPLGSAVFLSSHDECSNPLSSTFNNKLSGNREALPEDTSPITATPSSAGLPEVEEADENGNCLSCHTTSAIICERKVRGSHAEVSPTHITQSKQRRRDDERQLSLLAEKAEDEEAIEWY